MRQWLLWTLLFYGRRPRCLFLLRPLRHHREIPRFLHGPLTVSFITSHMYQPRYPLPSQIFLRKIQSSMRLRQFRKQNSAGIEESVFSPSILERNCKLWSAKTLLKVWPPLKSIPPMRHPFWRFLVSALFHSSCTSQTQTQLWQTSKQWPSQQLELFRQPPGLQLGMLEPNNQ